MNRHVQVDRDGNIATVTLDSGRKLNAMNRDTWQQLHASIIGISRDDDVRCVVLRGRDEAAFAAGADIAEFETVRADSASAKAYGDLVTETVLAVAACRHPTVALVQGVCVGGGLEIAGACDLRICGESSRFGIPINRLGLVMGYPELRLLIDLIGRSAALEILFEGRILDASEAMAKGLVNRIVPDADVAEEALRTARRIAAGAPLVARWHKKFARRLLDPAPLLPTELDEAYACYDTEDYRAGREAFLTKKTPKFRGR